ncbi:MAG: hypothetical protein JSS96_04700 [Bacteroidetes bacterium]|nr:hypothetical protein [Bacteroidota bacterium]
MKRIACFLLLILVTYSCAAQQKIKLVKMWHKTQMHVIFHEYHLFFSIRDINETMRYLHESDPKIYDSTSGLDTNQLYQTELEARDMEYHNNLQPLMQKDVGVFLLLRGHAYIEDKRHKKVKTIIAHIGEAIDTNGNFFVPVNFFDAKTNELLFAGIMNVNIQHRLLEL